MPCSCQKTVVTSPSGDALPTIEQDYAITKPPEVCKTCVVDNNCLTSDASDGTTLASSWLDTGCHTSGVTLLGRVGAKLARFAGSGFIQLENGIASVVPSVPLRLTTLWHRWWKPTPASPPILGAPLSHPYQVIADEEGNFHGIKGVDAEDSLSLWDSIKKEFAQTPVSEIPHAVKGLLPQATPLQLTGYTALPSNGSLDTVRQETALSGVGLVVLKQVVTLTGGCGAGAAYVASALPLPVGWDAGSENTDTLTLKYSNALGPHWA